MPAAAEGERRCQTPSQTETVGPGGGLLQGHRSGAWSSLTPSFALGTVAPGMGGSLPHGASPPPIETTGKDPSSLFCSFSACAWGVHVSNGFGFSLFPSGSSPCACPLTLCNHTEGDTKPPPRCCELGLGLGFVLVSSLRGGNSGFWGGVLAFSFFSSLFDVQGVPPPRFRWIQFMAHTGGRNNPKISSHSPCARLPPPPSASCGAVTM